MITPLGLIRKGIVDGDWVAVCEGFERMTGDRLIPPRIEDDAGLKSLFMTTARDLAEQRAVLSDIIDYIGQAVGGDTCYENPRKPVPQELEEEIDWSEDEDEDDTTTPLPLLDARALEVESVPELRSEPEPPADVESVRARELKELRLGGGLDKFKVEHKGKVQEDGKKEARREPFKAGPNRFKDDGKIGNKDSKIDKLLTKGVQPSERRDAPMLVSVDCVRCEKQFNVEPIFAPKSLAPDDMNSFVCDGCLTGKRKRR